MKNDLTKGNVMGAILRFVLPLTLGNIFQQLYNIVDTWIVGKYVGENALAAVGSVSCFIFLSNAIVYGTKTGITVIYSTYFGEKNEGEMVKTFWSGFFITLVGALGCALIFIGFSGPLLHLLQIPTEIYADSLSYFRIVSLGIPFLFLFNFGNAIYQSIGNSRVPFLILAISTLSNIVLDIVFVRVVDWGVSGAAIATLLSEVISAVVILILLAVRHRFGGQDVRHEQISRQKIAEIMRVAIPAIIQQGIVAIGATSVSALINSCGTAMIAGVNIAGKIEGIVSMPILTIAESMSVFTAQNIGAGKPERAKEGLKNGIGLCIGLVALLSVAIYFWGEEMVMFFLEEKNAAIVTEAMSYMISILFMMSFMSFGRCIAGFLSGKQKMQEVVISYLINIISRVVIAYSLFGVLGKYAIYLSNPISVAIGAVYLIIFSYNKKS